MEDLRHQDRRRRGGVSVALWAASVSPLPGGGRHEAPTASRGTTVDVTDLCLRSTVLHAEPGADVTRLTTCDPHELNVVVGVGDMWGVNPSNLLPPG